MKLELITEKPEHILHTTPILFIHGFWHSAWCWQEYFLPYFAQKGYVTHALSLRGHGESEGRKQLRGLRVKDSVEDIATIVEQLPVPPILVGHSMGGLLVQKYLETHRAPAAVLLASVPPHGAIQITLRFARRHPLRFLKANATLSLYPAVETPQLVKEAFFSSDMPQEQVNRYAARMQDDSYLTFFDALFLNLPRPRRVAQTPMLVLGASRDSLLAPSEVQATGRAYGTSAEIIDGIAHDMMLEHQWQVVAERIAAWLETQPSLSENMAKEEML